MAVLTVQSVSRSGLEATYASCAVGGDTFVNSGYEIIHIKNGHSGAQTVTITTPATTYGLAIADPAVEVTAGEERFIGPFPPAVFNGASDTVSLTYSGVTSLTIAILKVIPNQ